MDPVIDWSTATVELQRSGLALRVQAAGEGIDSRWAEKLNERAKRLEGEARGQQKWSKMDIQSGWISITELRIADEAVEEFKAWLDAVVEKVNQDLQADDEIKRQHAEQSAERKREDEEKARTLTERFRSTPDSAGGEM
jgi:hypothetical protein